MSGWTRGKLQRAGQPSSKNSLKRIKILSTFYTVRRLSSSLLEFLKTHTTEFFRRWKTSSAHVTYPCANNQTLTLKCRIAHTPSRQGGSHATGESPAERVKLRFCSNLEQAVVPMRNNRRFRVRLIRNPGRHVDAWRFPNPSPYPPRKRGPSQTQLISFTSLDPGSRYARPGRR